MNNIKLLINLKKRSRLSNYFDSTRVGKNVEKNIAREK